MNSRATFIPFVAAVGALLLRVHGIQFGLPIWSNLYIRPDESLVVMAAVNFIEKYGHPGTFAYPAFLSEICAAVFHLAFPGSVGTRFAESPSSFFLLVRWVSAIAGALTVFPLFGIARRMMPGLPAALAVTLYAVAPLPVRDAHFGVTDTLFVFWFAMALYFAMRYLEAPAGLTNKPILWMTVFFGFAIATKYAGLLAAPPLLTAMIVRSRERCESFPWKRVFFAGLAAAFFFTLTNPYVFLDFDRARQEVTSILKALYLWQPGDPAWRLDAALSQIARPLRNGPGGWWGLGLSLLAMGTWGWRYRQDPRVALVSQSVLGTFLVLIPFQHTVPYRYLLPAAPWIALLAALALSRAPRWPAAAVLAGFLLAIPTAATSWKMGSLLEQQDTRTAAGLWIQKNISVTMPIVWKGCPECEPQFQESAASVERRIEFAYRRYGPRSGEIVSQPYRYLAAAAKRSSTPAWEVHRNPPPEAWPARKFILITAAYPLPMVRPLEMPPRTVLARFPALEGDPADFELDRIDALFLPFRPLDRVLAPGPELEIGQVELP